LDKIPIALLGATGAVGQRFVHLLADHPQFSLELLVASANSSGERYKDITSWKLADEIPDGIGNMNVEALDFERIDDMKVIFSALPSEIAKDVEGNLASLGSLVFSNASVHRMDPDVPLLMADVNPEHLDLVKQQTKWPGYIVTNPNCTVCGLATVLAPLSENFGIGSVNVTTYQALSGAGYPGVPSLDISGNVLPFIEGEEEKVESECQKILGDIDTKGIKPRRFDVLASCARVPVLDGHLESVVVELQSDVELEDIKKVLGEFSKNPELNLPSAPVNPVIVSSKRDRPQVRFDLYAGDSERSKGMSVTVGRFKKRGRKLRLFLLVHNTIRGAAGTSILNAELALAKGLI
jgi:aspartate-semialdehyde dehydrogenase